MEFSVRLFPRITSYTAIQLFFFSSLVHLSYINETGREGGTLNKSFNYKLKCKFELIHDILVNILRSSFNFYRTLKNDFNKRRMPATNCSKARRNSSRRFLALRRILRTWNWPCKRYVHILKEIIIL